jgi:hypothetical protein
MEGEKIRRLIGAQVFDPGRGSFMPRLKPVTSHGKHKKFHGRRLYSSDDKHPAGFRFVLMDERS